MALPTTALAAPDSEIGIAKVVDSAVLNPNGTVDVTYTLRVTNPNGFDISNVQVVDDLGAGFGGSNAVPQSVTVTSSDFTVDHTGLADTTLLAGTDTLAAGVTGMITAVITLEPNNEQGPFDNTASAQGQTVCSSGVATTQGLAISQWFTGSARAPTTSVNLSVNFDDGTDANGFFQNTATPNRTGFTGSTANALLGGSVVFRNPEEVLSGEGWIAPPCGASTWELRALVGNPVGTYLAALAVDAVPTSSDIITTNGTQGFQHNLALFNAGIPTPSPTFTGTLGSPIGVFLQVDDRGSAFQVQLQERLDGGTWTNVPLSRIWAEKPVGSDAGGRAVSDVSDDGTDPDPTSDNGAGGVDDSTPVVLPSPTVDLVVTKTNTPGVNGNVDQTSDIVTSGTSTTYTVTVTNNGPDAVTGAIVQDIPIAGLSCDGTNPVTITGDGVPAGSFTVADLTGGSGITLEKLIAGETTTLVFTCEVI